MRAIKQSIKLGTFSIKRHNKTNLKETLDSFNFTNPELISEITASFLLYVSSYLMKLSLIKW